MLTEDVLHIPLVGDLAGGVVVQVAGKTQLLGHLRHREEHLVGADGDQKIHLLFLGDLLHRLGIQEIHLDEFVRIRPGDGADVVVGEDRVDPPLPKLPQQDDLRTAARQNQCFHVSMTPFPCTGYAGDGCDPPRASGAAPRPVPAGAVTNPLLFSCLIGSICGTPPAITKAFLLLCHAVDPYSSFSAFEVDRSHCFFKNPRYRAPKISQRTHALLPIQPNSFSHHSQNALYNIHRSWKLRHSSIAHIKDRV